MTNISADLVTALWDGLHHETRPRSLRPATELCTRIAQEGWCKLSELEDLLYAFDRRLYHIDLGPLFDYLELKPRSIYRRPRYWHSSPIGFESMVASDIAALLIFLEQIGFEVDASTLVDCLLPATRDSQFLTSSDLDIFRYPKLRGRHQFIMRTDVEGTGRLEEERFRTTTGCRLEMIRRGGLPYRLEVRGPNYRKRPEPNYVTCPYCGMGYMQGDRESADEHRSYHARIQRILDPRQVKEFVAAQENELEPELVRSTSPVWKHRQMYERACQFRREMGFDFVQWGRNSKGKDDDPNVHGFLFGDETGTRSPGTIVGACAFRREEEQWELQWVWIAPQFRRSGVLARRWEGFLTRFGDFYIGTPLSESMKAFARQHCTDKQKNLLGAWLD